MSLMFKNRLKGAFLDPKGLKKVPEETFVSGSKRLSRIRAVLKNRKVL